MQAEGTEQQTMKNGIERKTKYKSCARHELGILK
jgi:hypothetical protein